MSDLLTNVAPANLIILCIFILCIVVVLLKTMKELSLKIGGNTLIFSGRKASAEIVKVVTEYADFKYRLKDEQIEGIRDLREKAERVVRIWFDQYTHRLTVGYLRAIKNRDINEKRLTISIFSLLMELLHYKIFGFYLDIYEQNHLKDKTDSELRELASVNCVRLTDMFHEFMTTKWIDVMGEYDVLHKVCDEEEDFAKSLVLQTLLSFRDLSNKRVELINTVNDIDSKVRDFVQKTGALPNNAISLLADFYIPGIGLNKNSVNILLQLQESEQKTKGGEK